MTSLFCGVAFSVVICLGGGLVVVCLEGAITLLPLVGGSGERYRFCFIGGE